MVLEIGRSVIKKACRASALSQFMQSQLGVRWYEWGTEQIASNFAVANTSDPLVLPWSRYPAFAQGQDITASALVHFVGTHRYDNGIFTKTSQAAIRRLATFDVMKPKFAFLRQTSILSTK